MTAPASGTSSYLLLLQEALGLRDWVIILEDEPCDEGNIAFIRCIPGQKRAYLALGTGFADLAAEDRRLTLVHELLHPHFHECQAVVDRSIPAVGTVAGMVISNEHRNFIEHGVDAVAAAVAPLLPLPPEVEHGPPPTG